MTCARVEKCSPLGAPATPCQRSRQGARTQVAPKPEHTAATPPEPSFSRGRSVSKKRSIRGKKGQLLDKRFAAIVKKVIQKLLNEFKRYDSQRLRFVMQ